MKDPKKRINYDIKANEVQLITEDWKNLWIMPFKNAINKAEEEWLDLMEIWRNGDLVIVKILDYWKYLYKLKKQDQKNKQNSKAPELKTLRITFNIWDNDLNIKKKQAEWFAKEWNPLKVVLILRWRENQYTDIAKAKLESFVETLSELYKKDNEISKMWNMFSVNLKVIK